MTTTPDHARDYLHRRGVTDEQILALEAKSDQAAAWVRHAAHLAMQIRELADRGDQEGIAEAQQYISMLQEHMRSELDVPERGRTWSIMQLLLSQTASLAREFRGVQAQLAARDADDQLRSIEGRTDYDYQQRINRAQTRIDRLAEVIDVVPHGAHCKPWRLKDWPDDPAGCVCIKSRLTAAIAEEDGR
ncbi:hypothetical protein AB0P19_02215 [Microbacterium oleivorans]|uniref:hypothetical protein n=1 Tax=Microbacterium oleivorans TaxID=273677 RepID=UPI0034287466